jgi:threonine dehydrogenase-like Zn-dependent dehydrogenase
VYFQLIIQGGIMKALVFHEVGDIRLDNIADPIIENQFDVIVEITTSAICGTDLHFIRGTVGPMKSGTVLGHEAVGIVSEIGKGITNFKVGDRVIIPSTIACGACDMCHQSNFSQCNKANPKGPESGTAFFGGPVASGSFHGCQAEFVRVPFGNHNLVKLPSSVSDDKAILLSDIFPTAYFAVDIAKVKKGDIVLISGCGPVGQFAIAGCQLRGVSKIIAVDTVPSRLAMAQRQGAEIIDFNEDDPVEKLKELTNGRMADVVIDAVGVDAYCPEHGPAHKKSANRKEHFTTELLQLVPAIKNDGPNWIPGNAPSYVLNEAVDLVAKCGTISIIGVYPEALKTFPIGKAMNKNLKIVMGNCPHRAYIPRLVHFVEAGLIDPSLMLTQVESLENIVSAYKQFDLRSEGWIKVGLTP